MFKKLFRRTEVRNYAYRPGMVNLGLSVYEYRLLCEKVAREWKDNNGSFLNESE